MGRSERRAEVARFRRRTGGALLTHLVDARTSLAGHPLLQEAVMFWRAGIGTRKLQCFACTTKFTEETRAAAFLLAAPCSMPTGVSVSALCCECWSGLSEGEMRRAALSVLQTVLPGAHFADGP